MSQPHDGHRSFLPFGNPFRMIFPKGSYLSPELGSLLASFEQALAEGLKKLKPQFTSDIWSLSWLKHATTFLSEAHNNIKILITNLELPISNWDEKWIDMYLTNSIKLLDICIALSSELSRLDQCQILLQYALHILDSSEQLNKAETTLCDWMQQINSKSSKLEDCCEILQGFAGTLYSSKSVNSAKEKVLMRALYGVKAVTIFVCSVFTSALYGSSKPLITLVVPENFLWSEAFNDLQAEVLKGIAIRLSSENTIKLKEVEAVESSVKRVVESDYDHEDKEKLVNGSKELSLELDRLSKQVGAFFETVLMGRDALLCNIGGSDVVTMEEADIVDER